MRRKLNNYEPQVAQDNTFLQQYIYDKKLTINDLKLLKAILSKVKHNDSLFEDYYVIDYGTLDLAGVTNRRRYHEVEKSLIKLMNTFVTIRKEDRERFDDPLLNKLKGDRKLGLIRNDWTFEKKSMQICISIPEILKPFFLELADKEYTIYALRNISKFTKINELKLYELFSKWKNRGFFNITLENLRKYLEIDDNTYPKYANFKKRILSSSIEKINATTNLDVTFRELNISGDIIKKPGPGNRVHSIEFVIMDKGKFDTLSYQGKTFLGSDGRSYTILKVNEVSDGYVDLKLYDNLSEEVTSLMKPISKVEFLSSVICD